MIRDAKADVIHIATEGPLGLSARMWCKRNMRPFTTAYHTKFPEYIQARYGIPLKVGYAFMRWFHSAASKTMVATGSLKNDLESHGFKNLVFWSRGVDINLFHPREKRAMKHLRPIFLCVGRVAVEKNLEAFLDLDLPGSKVIIGDGPDLASLRNAYPEAHFLGAMEGKVLAEHFADADCFVFPSKTDTFGLVLLEAMASGVPVAAYPVTGPIDIVTPHQTGSLNEDLQTAATEALRCSSEDCRKFAEQYSWANCAKQFLCNLEK